MEITDFYFLQLHGSKSTSFTPKLPLRCTDLSSKHYTTCPSEHRKNAQKHRIELFFTASLCKFLSLYSIFEENGVFTGVRISQIPDFYRKFLNNLILDVTSEIIKTYEKGPMYENSSTMTTFSLCWFLGFFFDFWFFLCVLAL